MLTSRICLAAVALGLAGCLWACSQAGPRTARAQARLATSPALATPPAASAMAGKLVEVIPPLRTSNSAQPSAFGPTARIDATEIDALMADAIAAHRLPGAVIAIGRSDGILFARAYGMRALLPTVEPMTLDTIFDLASLTKPVATATAIMLLAQDGKLNLRELAGRYLPELDRASTRSITLQQLLLHASGLPADDALRDYAGSHADAVHALLGVSPADPPNHFHYSDVGYLWLGALVERVADQSLQDFTHERVFAPLGMHDTRYQPPPELLSRIAPTEITDDRGAPHALIHGVVHDPRAYRLGGIAGHAGLFSTAADLSRFARMLLRQGTLDGARVLEPETVAEMTRPESVGSDVRTLGWDMHTEYSRLRGHLLSERAFGHGGYTGTSLWIDPGQDLFVLFLSNRVHPHDKSSVVGLAGSIADAAVRGLEKLDPCVAPKARVVPGIDVLREQGFAALQGKRIGLVTHLAARTADGDSTLEVLRRAPKVQIAAVFSPEHGLDGAHEGAVSDLQREAHGLHTYSLFGETRKPTAEMLEGIDLLVVDLVDVGTRFFTYMSTLHLVLQAASERHLPVLVLDRPNPLGGATIEGPVLEATQRSFVNYYPLPIRHGLTAGELASLINAEEQLGVALQVIEARGWHRDALQADVGLPWTPPSPNLKRAESALLYPAIGLLESTNLSVGRGTDHPFEHFGAPFIDSDALLAKLRDVHLAGVRFRRDDFVPKQGPFAREHCHGLAVTVIDRTAFRPVQTGLEIARILHTLYPTTWEADKLSKLLGHAPSLQALLSGAPTSSIEALWEPELQHFRTRCEPILRYPTCKHL